MTSEISDNNLVLQYLQDNDEAVLTALIERYLPLIYGYSRRFTGSPDNAADITQEVFIKVWRNLKKFDTRQSFRPWIFTIAHNTALDWLKKKTPEPFAAFQTEEGKDYFTETLVASTHLLEEKKQEVRLALETLPEQYRAVVDLHTQDNLTFQEIATQMHQPLNTVKSRYRRALLLLRKHFGQEV